ncbi:MAG: RidA family protein [Gallicola sp.]|nr:RidA family protein [Gallicola sp.]
MSKIIATPLAPAAIGPYVQARIVSGLVYTSGQIPIDVNTGSMPEGIEAQTKQALTNVRHILEAAGSGLDKVVKTTVFLADMNDFAKMNAVYATFFSDGSFPTRSTVEVGRLPKDALVEVEAIAEV